jgi:hypothetical protein
MSRNVKGFHAPAVAAGGEEWFNVGRSGGIAGQPAIETDPSNLIRLISA